MRKTASRAAIGEVLEAGSHGLLAALPDILFHLDARGRILECVGGSPRELVLPRERLRGRLFHDLPDPIARRVLRDAIARARRAGDPVSVEYPVPIAGGTTTFEARIRSLADGELLVVSRNTTDLRNAVDHLARQRAFLRQVIDVNPNFIFAKDREGRFTLVNQAVAEAYGCTVEELLGRTDADFNSNEDEVRRFRADDLEVMDTRREKLIPEEPVTDSSGRVRWMQTIKRPLVSQAGSVDQILGVATDITLRRELEEQLRQSQKLEAIGLLAGGIAHDFNNLLTVILGFGEVILKRLGPDHPARRQTTEIIKAGERAAELTRHLLAFSRKQVLEPRVLDLREVIVTVEALLRRLIGEHIELQTACAAGNSFVTADRSQIEQVIMNLAVNARDAMPNGGVLRIETGEADLDAGYCRHHPGLEAGSFVVLAVTDTGRGMDSATVGRIFEPFFTTKESGKGTGLGLSTVHGIVRQSGGCIEVRSEPGQGTSFRIYLPRTEPDLVAVPGARANADDETRAEAAGVLVAAD